tara:strand:+ start:2389 stop:2586 length:198 start_codon:yes stop_codon:yes gene_type:complete
MNLGRENKMKKEKIKGEPFTEVEELLISVIDNFILWNTTESDRGIAEEYIANEHVDYNDWFKVIK